MPEVCAKATSHTHRCGLAPGHDGDCYGDTLDDWLAEWQRDGWVAAHHDVDRLVAEILRLRKENTGLGVRVQQGWKRIEDLEQAQADLDRVIGLAQDSLDYEGITFTQHRDCCVLFDTVLTPEQIAEHGRLNKAWDDAVKRAQLLREADDA